jgi:hypothetical protein
MKLIHGLSSLALLTIMGCAGKSTEVVVTGADPAAMRTAPAGAATLVFMDLQTIRPDALPVQIALPPTGEAMGVVAAATVPGCVTSVVAGNLTTYTFNCKAANTGTLTGTVKVTTTKVGSTTTYAEVFNLVSTVDTARKWTYTGNQTIVSNGSSATLTVAAGNPILCAYTDTATPANSKTYNFTANLAGNWATANRFVLSGGYAFTRPGIDNTTVAIAAGDPLVWTSSCDYPGTGTLALSMVDGSGVSLASASAVFGPTCGQVTLGGAALGMGSH